MIIAKNRLLRFPAFTTKVGDVLIGLGIGFACGLVLEILAIVIAGQLLTDIGFDGEILLGVSVVWSSGILLALSVAFFLMKRRWIALGVLLVDLLPLWFAIDFIVRW